MTRPTYHPGFYFKSCDQIGRRASQNEELIGNDANVFDKISQAVNSCYDFIEQGHYASRELMDVVTIVVPVLVVPNNRIWTVWCNQRGEIEQDATLTSNREYFLDKSYLIGDSSREFKTRYYLSHLEIVQIDAISEMVKKYQNIEVLQDAKKLSEFLSCFSEDG